MRVDGKVVIVTGAASGLGRATVERLAGKGATVPALDLNAAALASVASGRAVTGYPCDITEDAATEAAVARVVADLGAPSILVNCAGIAPGARILGREGPIPLGDFDRVIRVNLLGSFNVMRLVAHVMCDNTPDEEGERGVIINTASIAAYEGQIGQAAYAASKGGVFALTLPAARELARYGIRVVAIAPGLFSTPMVEALSEETRRAMTGVVPFPNRFGRPEEYAAMACSIITNSMMNGSVVRLDGALRMQPR